MLLIEPILWQFLETTFERDFEIWRAKRIVQKTQLAIV